MANKAPKKRMNRKLKRTVRKSMSALFMATAIGVAAIPVQENVASGTTTLSGNGTVVATEPLSEYAYPSDMTAYENINISYDIYDESKAKDGISIVEENGSYVEKLMYKVQKIPNSSENAIVAYNKDIIPKDNGVAGTLKIPNKIATSYVKFDWADVEAEYYNSDGTPNTDKLQSNYDIWHPENQTNKRVDFTLLSPDQIKDYALDLYAAQKGGSGNYEAQLVRVIDNSVSTSVEKYIPYNKITQEFMMESSYPISVIAAGAFSENAFSEVNSGASGSGSVKIYNLIIGDNIKGIGDAAFMGSENLQSISLGMGIDTVGNHAFQNCGGLRSATFEQTLTILGAEAFRGCNALDSITLKGALREIGAGAFADCGKLATIDLKGTTTNNTIGDFAFYNCINLNSVEFSNYGTTTAIGDGAFAVADDHSNSISGTWKNVAFPEGITSFGESVLEGRTNLETCILPNSYGAKKVVTLDGGFFRRCSNLKSVTINGPYVQFCINTNDRTGNPFWWVTSDEFYVEGPANLDNSDDYNNEFNYSYPRTSTINSKKTFKFTTKSGVQYFEVADIHDSGNPDNPSTPEDESKTADYYLINASTNALENYKPGSSSPIIKIVGDYNGVSVKSIKEGCFDAVKDSATALIIEDNTISEISERAFANFISLERVELGNSIESIGKEAFSGCYKLKDVYFNMDNVVIGKNAFRTNGTDGLIFHGRIEPGFAPFDWAMNEDNDINGAGLRVLYSSLDDTGLSVIYDNEASKSGKPVITLVSYPIFQAVDTQQSVASGALFESDVKNLEIPAGVTSIDSNAFYMSGKNDESRDAYIASKMGSDEALELVYYASMNTGGVSDAVGGLFSGGTYDDYSSGIVVGEPESLIQGNDYLESIKLNTVESLPDFAFDSCENLESVILGESLQQMGIAPFRGCTSLASVGGNSKYICENSIIYEVLGDGSYKLVQCLAGRALNTLSSSSDPSILKVSEIGESAFQQCESIQIVDFSDLEKLQVIPKNCFNGCTGLKQVILPESVNEIRQDAFSDIKVQKTDGTWDTSLTVKIPAEEVYINSDAFDKLKGVTIETMEDTSAWRFANDNGLTAVRLSTLEHNVKFLDWDFKELHVATVKDGANVVYPSAKLPTRADYTFTGWKCLTNGVTYESLIMDDCIFIAQYEPDKTTDEDGTTDADKDTDGDGIPDSEDTDKDGDGIPDKDQTGDENKPGNEDNKDEDKDEDKNDDNKDDNKGEESTGAVYTVTVINGSGSGSYKEGATVIVTANDPAAGKQFKNWTTEDGVTFASTRIPATTFTMPAKNVTVTANYEDKQNSSTGSGNGSVSGNTNNNANNSTQVIITKPGISDSDLASATVNGSKDNFIVKISETPDATSAVQAALANKYGDLDGIRYFAMDISLYDSTGTTKITDTTGYTVDITIPLPDELKAYAGNNKTAAVVNGQLEELKPKFSTIDGVACVTFRATHFSPYTVYVDTQHLSAGNLDSTPQTGDGIHPKWFLSMGLASLSVVLFMKKDKKTMGMTTA